MRGIAYRRHQARNKYARRVRFFYDMLIGQRFGLPSKRYESIKDFMEKDNPYILKKQGNFERHADIYKKIDKHRSIVKSRRDAKLEIKNSI